MGVGLLYNSTQVAYKGTAFGGVGNELHYWRSGCPMWAEKESPPATALNFGGIIADTISINPIWGRGGIGRILYTHEAPECNLSHKTCQGNSCVVISGAGADQCSDDASCAPPPTHNVCSGNLCVSVAGAGANQCSSDADCAPPPSLLPFLNQPPSATNLKVTQPDYCTISWPAAILSWNFTDPDGDTQSAYQVQVDNNSDFSSPEVDTNKVISSSQSYATLSGVLSWNTTYYWRLKVWDSKNLSSSWISGSSFATPRHQYPTINFSWFPLNPAVNGSVQFTDSSIVFGGASKSEWQWTFTDAAPPVSNQENPTTKFLSSANKSATLKMTDSDGFSCEGQRTISVQLPPPEWIEIAPF